MKCVSGVLQRMAAPCDYVKESSHRSLVRAFRSFKYRFTTGAELAALLSAIKAVLERHGSLEACFVQGLNHEHETVIPALTAFVGELSKGIDKRPRSLLPSPQAGSACKRLNLFLRWMVRHDDVDPGGWDRVPCSKLVVPLDVHLHRISMRLGLTRRKQADLAAALEITAAFRNIEPEDPVRYDFCLTRLGIRDDLDPDQFLRACAAGR